MRKRKPPAVLDGRRALRLLREVVRERPDFVYVAPDGSAETCMYVWDNQPSCVVGHVLARAGYPIETIQRLNEWGVIGWAIEHVNKVVLDRAAANLLEAAQAKQDLSEPWADALAEAERVARQFGVSA